MAEGLRVRRRESCSSNGEQHQQHAFAVVPPGVFVNARICSERVWTGAGTRRVLPCHYITSFNPQPQQRAPTANEPGELLTAREQGAARPDIRWARDRLTPCSSTLYRLPYPRVTLGHAPSRESARAGYLYRYDYSYTVKPTSQKFVPAMNSGRINLLIPPTY